MWKSEPWSFSPQMVVRPEYPPASSIVLAAARVYVRDVAFGVFLVKALAPAYAAGCAAFAAAGWSERSFFVAGTVGMHLGTFLALSVPFYVCDVKGWLKAYKLPRFERHILTDKQTYPRPAPKSPVSKSHFGRLDADIPRRRRGPPPRAIATEERLSLVGTTCGRRR